MKTDRLYAITLYLLNHGKTSAAELARKFEVSVRTIQRDIDSLCLSGVPVIAQPGTAGGYSLPNTYRMGAQMMGDEEYAALLTAMKGYLSASGGRQLDATVEKLTALTKKKDSSIILDFSVLRENDDVLMDTLKSAIRQRKTVRFDYTNAENVSRTHTVEPVAVIYRWYAWYLLAYSPFCEDYRTYKLVRMRDAEMTQMDFTKKHADAETILEEIKRNNPQQVTRIDAFCRADARAKAIEYLNGEVTCEYENGDCEMTLYVIEREHLWFGSLLSLGDRIIIRSPEHIRQRIHASAEKILAAYAEL